MSGLHEPFASAFIAANDAPLIGERAATRGCRATEVATSTPVRPALFVRATPARTGSNGGNLDAFGGRSADGKRVRQNA